MDKDQGYLGLFGGDFGDMHGELFSETRQDVNGDTRAEDLRTKQIKKIFSMNIQAFF